ncbi:hypothetical protein A9K55_000190 [Cordyceps militaris]|uniref:Uncharacterized protein n=1 Tax=Cordyceps militaris TaxID=73501 RepID=A0A2H4SW70_CORMI|nr:hypothetical protein A9K55_000190 [Cordyceps militaris]
MLGSFDCGRPEGQSAVVHVAPALRVFDKLSFTWQTPECYDTVTISEFMAFRECDFVTDEQRSAAEKFCQGVHSRCVAT